MNQDFLLKSNGTWLSAPNSLTNEVVLAIIRIDAQIGISDVTYDLDQNLFLEFYVISCNPCEKLVNEASLSSYYH